ncbi:RDD family protein [Bacillus sp. NP157]|nr:RDD family protein [Bacillus sp. NP157]
MDTELHTAAEPPPRPMAALWRRWLAFLIDWIILSLGGAIAGLVLFEPFARMGLWCRVLGFAIAVIYFGIFDSGWGGAGSPGKKVLSIRVVDGAGRVIAVWRALLRAAVICVPVLLNGMLLFPAEAPLGARALEGLVGGLLLASLYLLVFNAGTRQGLHDLATGTFVIRGSASREAMAGYTFWRPHLAIASVFLVVAVPISLAGLPVFLRFTPAMNHQVLTPPVGGQVAILGAWMNMNPATGPARHCTSMKVLLGGSGVGIDDPQLARLVAMRLAPRAHCHLEGPLPVRMQYGFDLGFASGVGFRDLVLDEAGLTRSP